MPMEKADFINLVTEAREKALQSRIIKDAWRYVGLKPFRSLHVLQALPK